MTAASRFLVIILAVPGARAIAAGIIYHAGPANSLPAFVPGHAAHLTGRHTTRALAGITAGAVLVIIAVITARAGRRSSRYYQRNGQGRGRGMAVTGRLRHDLAGA